MIKQNYGKLIGKGSFSKVYRQGESDHVTIVSADPCKEAQALFLSADCQFFAPLERFFYDDDGNGHYRQKYLGKTDQAITKLLDSDNMALYRALRALPVITEKNSYGLLYNQFETIAENPVFEIACNELIEMLQCVSNYTDNIGFEISPRNIRAINGKLVFLDCFFSRDFLASTLKAKRKKYSFCY
jgi:hypothetical protein